MNEINFEGISLFVFLLSYLEEKKKPKEPSEIRAEEREVYQSLTLCVRPEMVQILKKSAENDMKTRKIEVTLTQDIEEMANTGSRQEREERVLSMYGQLLLCKEMWVACGQAPDGFPGMVYRIDFKYPDPLREFETFTCFLIQNLLNE